MFNCNISGIFLKKEPLTVEQISEVYSGNKGLKWFLDKRLLSLWHLGLIAKDDEVIFLTKFKGVLASILLIVSLKILGINKHG